VPILHGYPSEVAVAKVSAGLLVLGGCVVEPGVDSFACPRQHRWCDRGRMPGLPESVEASASRMYAAGDLAGAEQGYRTALAMSIHQRGERDPETRALRHALAIVLSAAGDAERADAVYAPLRVMTWEDLRARLQELGRRGRPGDS
jgi:hypothetical protein